MHYHKCKEPHANSQVCGQVVEVVDGLKCDHCDDEHRCSAHHPDPQFRVEPTPPLKR